MKDDYKYFINYGCSFFPCHNLSDLKSCLFCSCPLYLIDCGGDFVIRNGIKDCSRCIIPHTEEGCNQVLETVNGILGSVNLVCALAENRWSKHCN
jgi:Zn-finger protein